MRIPWKILITASGLALGGCAYDGYYGGVGLGYGYNDYGYYNPYSYGGLGYPYGGYGYGYGSPYYGWYNDYYYPGTGIYVYDSYRRPRVWSDRERSYWASRQPRTTSTATTTTTGTRTVSTRPNWSGFNRHSQQVQSTDRHRGRP